MDDTLAAPPADPGLIGPALHVCTLWSFAVAQPLFDILGRHPNFFLLPADPAGVSPDGAARVPALPRDLRILRP